MRSWTLTCNGWIFPSRAATLPASSTSICAAAAAVITARVRITNHHTNIVCLERDGEVLRELPVVDSAEEHRADKSLLNVADILRFAAEVPLEDLLPLLEPQVSCNSAIAEGGPPRRMGRADRAHFTGGLRG